MPDRPVDSHDDPGCEGSRRSIIVGETGGDCARMRLTSDLLDARLYAWNSGI